MERCLRVLQEHEYLTRYNGGFWHIPNCELKKGYNGAYQVPIYPRIDWFGWSTIHALMKRNLLIITETNRYGDPKTVELKNEI